MKKRITIIVSVIAALFLFLVIYQLAYSASKSPEKIKIEFYDSAVEFGKKDCTFLLHCSLKNEGISMCSYLSGELCLLNNAGRVLSETDWTFSGFYLESGETCKGTLRINCDYDDELVKADFNDLMIFSQNTGVDFTEPNGIIFSIIRFVYWVVLLAFSACVFLIVGILIVIFASVYPELVGMIPLKSVRIFVYIVTFPLYLLALICVGIGKSPGDGKTYQERRREREFEAAQKRYNEAATRYANYCSAGLMEDAAWQKRNMDIAAAEMLKYK